MVIRKKSVTMMEIELLPESSGDTSSISEQKRNRSSETNEVEDEKLENLESPKRTRSYTKSIKSPVTQAVSDIFGHIAAIKIRIHSFIE